MTTQEEYENTLMCDTDLDKKILKLFQLNELAYEDLILSINTYSSVEKVAFELMINAKNLKFLEGNCEVAWDRLISK